MPLENGPVGSPEFKHNIETEMKAGKPQKQAVAIAYRQAGEKQDTASRLDAILNDCKALHHRLDTAAMRTADVAKLDASWEEGKHPRGE